LHACTDGFPLSWVLGSSPRMTEREAPIPFFYKKIPPTYPTLLILAYSTRVLSGGNASGNFRKSGKDRRFGLWEKTMGRGGFAEAAISSGPSAR
jgi:hypothetical protein